MGKGTSESLKLLRVGPPKNRFLYHVADDADITQQYPSLFPGVHKLHDFQLKLHVAKDIKPISQPVRRIPLGLRGKVEKLDGLVAKDMVEEVPGTPTSWVSSLVVVLKPNGDIQLYVDMQMANTAIPRERHLILTTEKVLYNSNGSAVFSKLDLKWGFQQTEMEPES